MEQGSVDKILARIRHNRDERDKNMGRRQLRCLGRITSVISGTLAKAPGLERGVEVGADCGASAATHNTSINTVAETIDV